MQSWVGYTGGSTTKPPTYKSVCAGDGHTEALRLEFDPASLSYADLVREFLEDPKVKNVWDPDAESQDPQYRTAIFAQDAEQMRVAKEKIWECGKQVPILEGSTWYNAEEWHQHFLGGFKDFPEEDEEDGVLLV